MSLKSKLTPYFANEQRIVETGQPLIGNLERICDRGGNLHWVSNSEVPIKDAQGRVTGLAGVVRDVTFQWGCGSLQPGKLPRGVRRAGGR